MPEVSQVIIGIGSAQKSYTSENLFTAGERFEMILATINEEKVAAPHQYLIVPIIDLDNNNQWISYLQSLLPRFNAIYTNNHLIQNLVRSFSSINIHEIPFKNRKIWSSTEIRQRMLENATWENLVPPSTKKLILEFGGTNRLKSLSTSDKK